MRRPSMIFFDNGQTLTDERKFGGVEGMRALLAHARSNPRHRTAEQLQAFAEELNGDLYRFCPDGMEPYPFEVHFHHFQKYLFDAMEVEFDLTRHELERIYWDNSAPATATEHMGELLDYLNVAGIRTAVVSNFTFCGQTLKDRLDRLLPQNRFEFIIASSEYIFKKPHPRIFQLALTKAGLVPGEAWHCGDNARCDVEGAAGCGIFPVWYRGAGSTDGEPPRAEHLEIGDWGELIRVLQAAGTENA